MIILNSKKKSGQRDSSFIIGIDGGGTNTRGIISDLKGEVLAEVLGGASNYQTQGLEAAIEELRSVILTLLKETNTEASSIEKIVAGVAGVGRKSDEKHLKRSLIEELPDDFEDKVYLTTDLHVALYGAIGQKEGLIVNAGTGATAMGKDVNGRIERADGWGFLLGDEGSGFWIGLESIKRSLKSHDGRGSSTKLKERLKQHFSLEDFEEIVPLVYDLLKESDHGSIASLSELVFATGRQGDQVANEIISEAGDKLGETASAVIKKLEYRTNELNIVLNGGVFFSSAKPKLLESFEKRVGSVIQNWNYQDPLHSPEVGALIVAAREVQLEGFDPNLGK